MRIESNNLSRLLKCGTCEASHLTIWSQKKCYLNAICSSVCAVPFNGRQVIASYQVENSCCIFGKKPLFAFFCLQQYHMQISYKLLFLQISQFSGHCLLHLVMHQQSWLVCFTKNACDKRCLFFFPHSNWFVDNLIHTYLISQENRPCDIALFSALFTSSHKQT